MDRLLRLIVLIALCCSIVPSSARASAPAAPASATTIPTIANLSNKIRASFLSVEFNADGSSTWRYQVEELAGAANLTAWTLELPTCATFVSASPADGAVQNDPTVGFNGVRWPVAAGWTKGEFSVTLKGTLGLGSAKVAATGGATVNGPILGPSCGAAFPRIVTLSNGYRITLVGLLFVSTGVFRWRYIVDELPEAQDLSNWVLELKGCAIVTAAPEPWETVKPDPNAKLYGVKWQTGAGFSSGEFTVTTRGVIGIGVTRVAAKGPDVVHGEIVGAICGVRDDDEPPAVIIIGDDDIKHDIEIINQIIFINISITIINTGGSARGVFLILGKEFRDLCDLADVGFLDGKGYVKDLDDGEGNLRIGIGQNNRLDRDDKVNLKIKFKAKQKGNFKFDARFRLSYGDSSGDKLVDIKPLPIVVAPVVIPVVKAPIVRLPVERIDVRFRAFWVSRGGLLILGLPLTEPIVLTGGITVQYLERARLELHPNPSGGAPIVLLGRLGVELGYATPAVAPPASPAERRWYTPETGHLIAPEFRTFWQGRGGLAVFGFPIGEAVVENGRRVQYYERTRLELHAGQAGVPSEVLIGHLGVQALERNQ